MSLDKILADVKVTVTPTSETRANVSVELSNAVFEQGVAWIQEANPTWSRKQCEQRFAKQLSDSVMNSENLYPCSETEMKYKTVEVPHEPAP
jgi:hypothetical protein